MREELRDDLNVSWISFPMFRDHTREESVGYEQYDRARRPTRLPGRLDIGWSEIHGSRVAPALDRPPDHLSADAMPPGAVSPQRVIGEGPCRLGWRRSNFE